MPVDTPHIRKARGAFFTPPELAKFIASWAIRSAHDRIVEPSCGDAIFLASAAIELAKLADPAIDLPADHLPADHLPADHLPAQDMPVHDLHTHDGPPAVTSPSRTQLVGYDIHQASVDEGRSALQELGFDGEFHVGDFFTQTSETKFDAVIGNPPFIRFQGFGGLSRAASLERALAVGVNISGLASSWAAFVVHASTFLTPGGRMGLVLPAELLSVNYASPIREYLMRSFSSIELVLFEELVFPGVQADVVVLLADGYGEGSSDHFALFQTKNVASIDTRTGISWSPPTPSAKWTDALVTTASAQVMTDAVASGLLGALSDWGTVNSGMVTGANNFFALTPAQADELGIARTDCVNLLPSGLSLTGLDSLTHKTWVDAGSRLKTLLFFPREPLSEAARAYIAGGEAAELDERYKCRIRSPWWRVPVGRPPHLFVSYMSGSAPRVVANRAKLHHLNSIHGLHVTEGRAELAQLVLPLMTLNTHSLLSAELEGRTYGGGVLKLEPREASRWLVVSPEVAREIADNHVDLLARGKRLLRSGDQSAAAAIADTLFALAAEALGAQVGDVQLVREARSELLGRRLSRGGGKLATTAGTMTTMTEPINEPINEPMSEPMTEAMTVGNPDGE
jgi:adenine-specific DNA-methyltransferase